MKIHSLGFTRQELNKVALQLCIWKIVSAIGIMSMHGVEDVHIHEGTVNGDVFEDFVCTTLLPTLQPFSGSNSHSVVVLNNVSFGPDSGHHN